MENHNNEDARPLTWHPVKNTLIVGYGNPDREDDGVAWHILQALAKEFEVPISLDTDVGIFPEGRPLDFYFNLQLMPEMALEMLAYQRICFVDAHTGAVPEKIHIEKIQSQFQNSPLTHHMTPQSLVSILEHLYQHTPDSYLVSVKGYQFRFHHQLSDQTQELAAIALESISQWIRQDDFPIS